MNDTVQAEGGNALDKVKWFLIVAILAATVVGNNMYGDMSVLIRAGGFVIAVAICLFLASQTEKGRNFLVFAKESRTEVRKVVWPNRQEATHTTLIIAAATVLMAMLMWGLDAILMWAVGLLTGLRF
ncbi:MAG: preprotein translocase subunit SecE [Algicola sp.]|nr:preprotein translocase subunit SecE [Algicola sp.]